MLARRRQGLGVESVKYWGSEAARRSHRSVGESSHVSRVGAEYANPLEDKWVNSSRGSTPVLPDGLHDSAGSPRVAAGHVVAAPLRRSAVPASSTSAVSGDTQTRNRSRACSTV